MSRMQSFDWRRICGTTSGKGARSKVGSRSSTSERFLRLEPLEDRRMLALTPQAPFGGLVYTDQFSGDISSPGETDVISLTLDAGQSLTVVANASAGLTPSLELADPTAAAIGMSTASAPGQAALLQTVTIASAGTYTLRVTGGGSTTGRYDL